ncbi:MAG: hypothetical protein IJS08_12360, partial [Victivallales bacterium]|nr:hypothetical protein [Victivallales bacterium]
TCFDACTGSPEEEIQHLHGPPAVLRVFCGQSGEQSLSRLAAGSVSCVGEPCLRRVFYTLGPLL